MLLKVANSTESFRLDQLLHYQHKDFNEIMDLNTGKRLVSIGAWCLMTNHFHILLRQEVEGGITKFMKKLGTGYSMYFNIKYNRNGALFGGPFKSKYISEDLHLKHLFGYIHLNALDIKFSGWEEQVSKQHPKEWNHFLENYPYSSYHEYMGQDRPEQNVITKTSFPDYFTKKNSFKDFINSYLSFSIDE
jgi:putative transposase